MQSAKTPTNLFPQCMSSDICDIWPDQCECLERLQQSSDLGRSPASSPVEVGQEGNQTIHDCRNTPDCLCLKCFEKLSQRGNQ
jgi:hypothetical protein